MKSNPPIKGHELLFEGHGLPRINPATDDYQRFDNGDLILYGGCRCGAYPDRWPTSVGATRRWHREHKDELRWAAVREARARGRH